MVLSLDASCGYCGGDLRDIQPSLPRRISVLCTKQAYRFMNNCEWAPHFFRSFAAAQLFHGALLGCKLGRLWRRLCSKGAKPPRAHGLAMHQASIPPREQLQMGASLLPFICRCTALPWCSPWLQVGEVVEEALLQGCQASKSSWSCHAPSKHTAS